MGRDSVSSLTDSTSVAGTREAHLTPPKSAPIITIKHNTAIIEEDEMSSGKFTSNEWDYESTLVLIHVFVKYGLRLEASTTAAESSIYNLAIFRKFNTNTCINGRRKLISLKERWKYLFETYQERVKSLCGTSNSYSLPFWEFHEHMENALSSNPLVLSLLDNAWHHPSAESDFDYCLDHSDEEDKEEEEEGFRQSITTSKITIQKSSDINDVEISDQHKYDDVVEHSDHVNIYESEHKRLNDVIEKSLLIMEKGISTMEKNISTMEKGMLTMEKSLSAMEKGISAINNFSSVMEKRILMMENNDTTRHDFLKIQKGLLTQFKIAVEKIASANKTYDTNIDNPQNFDKIQNEFFMI